MTRQGRAVVILLGVLAVLASAVAGVAVTMQMHERDLRLKKERELLLLKSENESLQQQVSEVRQAKQQVEAEATRLKTQLEQAASQLAEAVRAKEALAASVDERQQEVTRLSKDLEQIRSEREGVARQIDQLRSQQDTLQEQLAQAEQAKADLEAKVSELSEQPTVELEPVVVTNPQGAAAPALAPASNGQVIVVNREYDFIVMNLGRNQGLEIGQEFQIVRGQEVLGRVKVEKIYDELSAAAILPNSKKEAIREGDEVRAL